MTKIAAVLFVKNEVEDIAWWLAWHFACGIDTIFVYDDHSTDGTWELIQASAWAFDVRCRRAEQSLRFNHRQKLTYMAALDEARSEFDWLIFLDADEYLDIRSGEDVHTFLARYPDADGVAINWTCFGSNGHVVRPTTPNVFESYPAHSTEDLEENKIVKSFVRPKATRTEYFNPHRFHINGRYVLPSGEDVPWSGVHPERITARPDWSVATIRHYIVRSVEHYVTKTRRRSDIRDAKVGIGLFNYHDTNNAYSPVEGERYDRFFSYVHRIENVVGRRIVSLLFPQRLVTEPALAVSNLHPAARFWTVKTDMGAFLCHDRRSGTLIQAREPMPDEFVSPVIAFSIEEYPGTVYLMAPGPAVGLHIVGDSRVSSVLSFHRSIGEENNVGLRNPHTGKAMSFTPLGEGESVSTQINVSRDWVLGWEGLTFSDIVSPLPLRVIMAADVIDRTVRGQPLPHYQNGDEALVADAYMAAISAWDRQTIDPWNAHTARVPTPWMEDTELYSL